MVTLGGDNITHTLNLISDPWIPIVRADGTEEFIAPWQLTLQYDSNPIVGLNSPRPDFQGSLIQFLIGLAQTCIAPRGNIKWKSFLTTPPDPDSLEKSFSSVSDYFHFAGDGILFMQDRSVEQEDPKPIDSLLIEMPGENTVKKNTDFFLKRNTVSNICPVCAATALYTLQTNGPSGGAGHRTGLRGGGPLTTIVVGRTLWDTIWLNVLNSESFYPDFAYERQDTPEAIFPWAGEIRTSENKQVTGIKDVNPLQMFWGMGRRILLNNSDTGSGECDICGVLSDHLYQSYYTRPYGVNYDETWQHCLSPYYGKNNEELLPIHCQPGGIQYNHWLGIFQEEKTEKRVRKPAAVISSLKNRAPLLKNTYPDPMRIWAFGFDMDNMKARCWYEGQLPVYLMDPEILKTFEVQVEQVVKSAEYTLDILTRCIKEALFGAKSKRAEPAVIKARFWHDTEPIFYSILDKFSSCPSHPESSDKIKLEWLDFLKKVSLSLFDEYSQVNYLADLKPAQIVRSRTMLLKTIHPGSPKISSILGLLAREKRSKR